MAAGKKHGLGELQGDLKAWLARVFTGQKFDPNKLNPYREPDLPAPPKSKEQLERESALAWQLMDRFFGGK